MSRSAGHLLTAQTSMGKGEFSEILNDAVEPISKPYLQFEIVD
jgi:hypothetical protein